MTIYSKLFLPADFLYRYKNKGKIFGVKRYIKKNNRLKIWKKYGPPLVGICRPLRLLTCPPGYGVLTNKKADNHVINNIHR